MSGFSICVMIDAYKSVGTLPEDCWKYGCNFRRITSSSDSLVSFRKRGLFLWFDKSESVSIRPGGKDGCAQ